MRDQYIRTGQGFLCVYSITSRSSFEAINHFRNQILRVKDEDSYPLVILGNKCDLEKDREVATSEGKELAKSFEAPFVEASAKARINVEEAFFQLVREIRTYNTTTKPSEGYQPHRTPKKKKAKCNIL
jgi:GTPase KRas protein